MVLLQDTSEPLKLCFISGLLIRREGRLACVEEARSANPHGHIKKRLGDEKGLYMAENK